MSALKGHPKGLYLIFATSTAERFSYYGMRAIFILFLTQALLFDKEAAASIYGSYTGLVYLTPLIERLEEPVLLLSEYEIPDETEFPEALS